MNRRHAATRWGARLGTTVLLSLVPAYAAGLVAMALLAARGARNSAVVGTTFFVTLLLTSMLYSRSLDQDQEQENEDPPRKSASWIPWALGLLAIPLSVMITYPNVSDIGRLIIGNTGDSGVSIYLLEWQAHASVHAIDSYFDVTIFAPESFTLFWGPAFTPLVPAYALFKVLTNNPITSFNLLMILATVATLLATYLFARKCGFGPWAAGLAGVLFATTGQRTAHLGHLDSFQTLWIPIFGILLLAVWEKQQLRHGVFLGAALGISLLSAPYYFLSGIAVSGVMVLLHLPTWRELPRKSLGAAGAVTLLIAGPVLVMSKLAGLSRSPEEVVPIGWADFYHPGSYVPAMSWLSQTAGQMGGGKTLENWLFGSIVLTLLGAIGAWAWLNARRMGRCPLPKDHPNALAPLLAAMALSGLVMAVGPYLKIGGTRLPLPMLFLMRLPGFDSARVTGRFIAPALLALTIVSLIGLEKVTSRMRRQAKPVLVAGLAGVVLLMTQSFYPAAALDVSGPPADVNRALATRAEGLVVELPWSGCPGYGCLFTEPPRMIWSRFDWFPRLGGYSGYIPDYWIPAQESLGAFPDERALEFLRKYDARYVILRVSTGEQGTHFTSAQAAEIAERARRNPEISKVEKHGQDFLLTLR